MGAQLQPCVQYLYNLHEVADKNGDGQMADFVEVMLEEQVNSCALPCLLRASALIKSAAATLS